MARIKVFDKTTGQWVHADKSFCKSPVKGVDYYTDEDKAEIIDAVKTEVPLVKSAEEPTIVDSIDKMTDKSKHYVLSSDGYFYAYEEVKNYNLLKLSEISYSSRLDNTSSEIISSTIANCVSGWFPVTPGKYYAKACISPDSGKKTLYYPGINRVQLQLSDGTIKVYNSSGDNEYPYTLLTLGNYKNIKVYGVDDENAVYMRVQFNIGGVDISTFDALSAYQVMIVEGDTAEEALSNAYTFEYMEGDADDIVEWYSTGLAYNQPADYEDKIVKLESDVSKLKSESHDFESLESEVASLVANGARSVHDANYIANDRFIRSIANFRDTTNAKDFEITINNNSGKTIKNAAIYVGLHNKVGVNPDNNNLPFQIYDDVISEPIGFKFFDGSTELPYYIESESNCNYIVDKNIKTDQKTMAVFSDGKIAVYNATVSRMQITSNDGATWTNICNEITSTPYRILLPDSQDNLFVASNSGYRLYKYTSADGYMVGTQVIDMEADQTKIGSILAEDSDGNLYLGTYQGSPWRCVVRKSTDHGNTWAVVFDSTECQHVHNIYINKKVTPNEIFIGLDNAETDNAAQFYVSTDGGATWKKVPVPYQNRDHGFKYAGENFYIGIGERNVLGGAALYKTTDYNDPDAYYVPFDNCQGMRDVTNVIEGSDDILIAGGCKDDAVHIQQLFLSEDRGETWKTVLANPCDVYEIDAGLGLRTFTRKGNEILSQTSTDYAMRFVYGNGAKTILAVVSVGDVPVEGKTITLKTGYVANVEQMEKVLTSYEKIDGKVADIRVCDGYVIDTVSNKRVMTSDTELVNCNIRLGQTSEPKILADHAYRLNGGVNMGKLSRLDFNKGFTVSFLHKKKATMDDYWDDDDYHVIFQIGDTTLSMYHRWLVLKHGATTVFGAGIGLDACYLRSDWDAYLRVTVCITGGDLPTASIYTNNSLGNEGFACEAYPITENFSTHDFVVGKLNSDYADMPNIASIEIYNRVLTPGEIMALTNGCNLITDGTKFN